MCACVSCPGVAVVAASDSIFRSWFLPVWQLTVALPQHGMPVACSHMPPFALTAWPSWE
jgi:hypothetical protein